MEKIIKFIKLVLKKFKMGIVDKAVKNISSKVETKPQMRVDEVVLTEQELEFILIKLRDSNYRGHEFDTYARIYKKLVDQLKK